MMLQKERTNNLHLTGFRSTASLQTQTLILPVAGEIKRLLNSLEGSTPTGPIIQLDHPETFAGLFHPDHCFQIAFVCNMRTKQRNPYLLILRKWQSLNLPFSQ